MSDDIRPPSALDRIFADDKLRRVRSKLSFDEIRRIIRHVKDAHEAELSSTNHSKAPSDTAERQTEAVE